MEEIVHGLAAQDPETTAIPRTGVDYAGFLPSTISSKPLVLQSWKIVASVVADRITRFGEVGSARIGFRVSDLRFGAAYLYRPVSISLHI